MKLIAKPLPYSPENGAQVVLLNEAGAQVCCLGLIGVLRCDEYIVSRAKHQEACREIEQAIVTAFNGPFNGLSAAEAERLAMLAEENAEVIKAACKILRHGFESFNPDRPDDGSNRKQLFAELTDVAGAKQLMVSAGDIPSVTSQELEAAKNRKLRYAHHQGRAE